MSKGKLAKRSKEHYSLADVERGIKHKNLLYIYAEHGDMDSLNLLIDAETALKKAKPTQLQLNTVELVWVRGMSLVEASKQLAVTPQAVKFNLDLLKVKVKRVLDVWKLREKREGQGQ